MATKGDLHDEEDLFIEGTIEGKITVKQGSVTVGEPGPCKADIHATNIQVAGDVRGILTGSEQVVARDRARRGEPHGEDRDARDDMESVDRSPKNGSSHNPSPAQSV